MATSPELMVINAASKSPMKLVTKSGFFKVNDQIIIGDLYRDPSDLKVSIVIVTRAAHLDDLDAPIVPQ